MKTDYYYQLAKAKNDWTTGNLKRTLDFILAQKPKKLLEVGCAGSELPKLLPKSVKYTGVDRQPGDYVVSRWEDLPFDDNSFDLVFSAQTIQMVSNPRQALRQTARVVRPGGHIVLIAPNLERPWSYIPAVRHYSQGARFMLLCQRIVDVLRRFLGSLPFRTITQNYVDSTGRFERGDDDLRYIVSAYEIARFARGLGLKIIKRSKYFSGGTFFIFQK